MRATSEKYRLNSYDGEELPFENYMKLDNTIRLQMKLQK